MRTNLFLGVAAVALVIPAAASAQETTSSIRGTVTNSGQSIAGATVTITDVGTNTRSNTTTGADGTFNVNGLRPGGPYTLEVSSPVGTTSVTDIYTVVGQPYDVPVELAAATDDIVVTASSVARAGTTSDGPQTVLTQREISRVASVNRDIRDLARRSPFARIEDTAGGGRSISFAGVNPRFNRFSIDGVVVSDNFGLNPDANPTRRGPVPIDSIGQFSVSIAPYDIRQGNFLGGAIDAVLLTGTNAFHGNGFYSQNTDGLTRDPRDILANAQPLDFKSETYGATLAGPIIKDKLFFMVSAERNTEGNPLSPTLAQVPNLNVGLVNNVQGIANSVYSYDAGGLLALSNDKDEKIVGKITWNINDDQRLSVSYINAYDVSSFLQNSSTSNSSPSIGLSSDAYQATELLRAGIAQLNSQWTDTFSTEARFLYKSYERGANPLNGLGFAQFGVCTDATSAGPTNSCTTGQPRVFFGPDRSRQSNQFYTDTYSGSVLARLNMNGHDLKAFGQYDEVRIFNLFLQDTAGNYYFDSLADFQNRTANQVTYQAPASGNVNDAAADFKYRQFTFGVQDDWRISDRLTFSYGARYDLYDQNSPIPFNPGFLGRYGFSNTKSFKGLGLFQPRLGLNFEPINDVKIRGGFGIFGGGTPDVYLSNSYSNAGAGAGGVGINSVTVQRTGANTYTLNGATLDPTIGAAVLNNVQGNSIPPALQALIPNTGPNSLANINALSKNFHIPSVYKTTLSADWTPRDFLGGGWTFGADYYFSSTKDSIQFIDFRSVPVGILPDGRTRYGPLVGTNTNTDIVLQNGNKGRSHIGVVRVDKRFDFGLSAGIAYSLADVKDETPATSSTAGSNYGNGAFLNNVAAYGTANDQVSWSFKYNVGFDHAFFGDYRTIFQLFGETQAGRPYSITMQDVGSAARSAVFGLTGRDDRHLLYVPTAGTDAIVSYDTAATQTALDNIISTYGLDKYRGSILPRNVVRSRAYTRIDLHLEQEIPTFIGNSRFSVFADIENLPNLLKSSWGGFRQAVFPYLEDVVSVQCLTTPVATGIAPTGTQAATSSAQPCAQYRYSAAVSPNPSSLELRRSLYFIRLGARFKF